MKLITTKLLSHSQQSQILTLWNAEYPVNLAHKSIKGLQDFLAKMEDAHHVLLVEGEVINGWYVDFIRDNERWFTLILRSEIHGRGYGTQLLNQAKALRPELNGWVIDHNNDVKLSGSVYQSPLAFYLKNGFQVIPEIRLELDVISAVKIVWRKQDDERSEF